MPKLVKYKAELSLVISKDDKYFVAYCPALNLTGYGMTEKQAKSSFEENFDIFIEETLEKGTLSGILFELGWTLKKFKNFLKNMVIP